MTRVSIIIPAYNAESTLAACIEACLRQRHPEAAIHDSCEPPGTTSPSIPLRRGIEGDVAPGSSPTAIFETEIWVVDDGSTDGTASVARRFPSVHYLYQTNAGPAAARNLGAREAQGEILAFTDSDCVPRPDWIERLLAGFEESVAGVGGTYAIENPQYLLARLVHAEIAARHATYETTNAPTSPFIPLRRGIKGDVASREVDFLGSFNVAYRRTAFEAAGGFNEAFRDASGEDNDLAYRLHDQGWKLHFQPDAVVGHVHPCRLLPYLRAQKRHGYWRMKLYRLHPKRAKGDRYAGWSDLAGPPAFLGLLALLTLTLLGWCSIGFAAGYALVYAGLRVPLACRLLCQTRRPETIWFWPLAILRDGARAAGLLHGLWAFHGCNKEQG